MLAHPQGLPFQKNNAALGAASEKVDFPADTISIQLRAVTANAQISFDNGTTFFTAKPTDAMPLLFGVRARSVVVKGVATTGYELFASVEPGK